jgi:hypothetical protein
MKQLRLTVLVLAVVMALGGTSALGQEPMQFGVKGGLDMAKIHGSESEGSEYKIGFTGGVFFTKMLSPTFGIQPEVLYSQKGFEVSEMGFTVKFKADYIEIPILLKFQPQTDGSLKWNVYGGPVVAFAASTKLGAEGFGASIDMDIANKKSVDFGFAFGSGFTLPAGSGHFVMDARLSMGLAKNLDDVSPEETIYYIDLDDIESIPTEINLALSDGSAPDWKNIMFALYVGYAFPIGGGGQ